MRAATSPNVSPNAYSSDGPIRATVGIRSPKWWANSRRHDRSTCALLVSTSIADRGHGVAGPVVPVVS
jgi:hypothetical protein